MGKQVISDYDKIRKFVISHPNEGELRPAYSKKNNKYYMRGYLNGKSKKLTEPVYDYIYRIGTFPDFGLAVKKDDEIFVTDRFFNIILEKIDFIAQINRGDFSSFFIKEGRTGIINKDLEIMYYDEIYSSFEKRKIDFNGKEIDFIVEDRNGEELDDLLRWTFSDRGLYAIINDNPIECKSTKDIECYYNSNNIGYFSLEDLYEALGLKWNERNTPPLTKYENEIYSVIIGDAKTAADPIEIEVPKGKEFNMSDLIFVKYGWNLKSHPEIAKAVKYELNGADLVDGFFYCGKYYELAVGDSWGGNLTPIWTKDNNI